jgi:hypothetical protein
MYPQINITGTITLLVYIDHKMAVFYYQLFSTSVLQDIWHKENNRTVANSWHVNIKLNIQFEQTRLRQVPGSTDYCKGSW